MASHRGGSRGHTKLAEQERYKGGGVADLYSCFHYFARRPLLLYSRFPDEPPLAAALMSKGSGLGVGKWKAALRKASVRCQAREASEAGVQSTTATAISKEFGGCQKAKFALNDRGELVSLVEKLAAGDMHVPFVLFLINSPVRANNRRNSVPSSVDDPSEAYEGCSLVMVWEGCSSGGGLLCPLGGTLPLPERGLEIAPQRALGGLAFGPGVS